MRDAIIIGAGIIGATVARLLRKQGKDVLLLDSGQGMAGTPPSGGHLKPSWFGGMKKGEYEPAMKLLDEAWGLKTEEFSVRAPVIGGVATATIYRVDTDVVVREQKVTGRAERLILANVPGVVYTDPTGAVVEQRGRLLLVATGAWCGDLVEGLSLQSKQGVSFRVKGNVSNFIRPWAPYKQVVCHQQAAGELWAGDGSAIIPKNWTTRRTEECFTRCLDAVRGAGGRVPSTPLRTLTGLRPYCPTEGTDPCLLRKLGPGAWVATGAGKSGTISAGWVAKRVLA